MDVGELLSQLRDALDLEQTTNYNISAKNAESDSEYRSLDEYLASNVGVDPLGQATLICGDQPGGMSESERDILSRMERSCLRKALQDNEDIGLLKPGDTKEMIETLSNKKIEEILVSLNTKKDSVNTRDSTNSKIIQNNANADSDEDSHEKIWRGNSKQKSLSRQNIEDDD